MIIRRFLTAAALLGATLVATPCVFAFHHVEPWPSSATFEREAVAADHPQASAAGAEILSRGGNAVDAAVATSFALSVVRPFSCGIGGGGFMVVHLREHPRLRIGEGGLRAALNYRETAPAAITPDYYERLALEENGAEASSIGGRAVAVPGTVAGLLEALERWGTLDRAAVMAPAIRLAREGFAVDAAYASAARTIADKFAANPSFKARFAFTWERLLRSGRVATGDVIRLPEQAETLEAISAGGARAFYTGPLARRIVEAVRADGGIITEADLAAYRPADAEPLAFEFRGRTFLTMPPPSSGGVCMAQTLGILQRTALDRQIERGLSAGYLHFLAESFKHAFADRARALGDPAFVRVPIADLLDARQLSILAGSIAVGRTGSVYGTLALDDPAPDAPPPDDGGTSHLCVLDARGNAVACTETINLEFGSLVAVAGFCLNNEMDDFTTRRGEANQFGLRQGDGNLPAPGKRPLSSMSPTIVLGAGGRVEIIAGASGGPRIITATTQVILNVVLFGHDAGRAVASPRIHHQWMPNMLEAEPAFEDVRWQGMRMLDWLRKQRHQVARATRHASVQAIVAREPGRIEAASDPRKGGAPAGR